MITIFPLIDSGILVKVDTDRFHNPTQKAKMFVNSNVTSNNVPINPAQVFNTKIIQADHVLPHSKGGATSEENGKLEEVHTIMQKEQHDYNDWWNTLFW